MRRWLYPTSHLLLGPLEVGGGAAGSEGVGGTHLEVGELSESLFAARMRALVGSVACVDSARACPVRELPLPNLTAVPAPEPGHSYTSVAGVLSLAPNSLSLVVKSRPQARARTCKGHQHPSPDSAAGLNTVSHSLGSL